MAEQGYAYTSHEADGVQTVFPFAFVGVTPGYFNAEHIFVFHRTDVTWNPVPDTDWNLTGVNTLEFITPPTSNPDADDDVIIRRIMPKDAPYAGYDVSTRFTKATLNNSFLQQLYLAHEALDTLGEDISGSSSGINIIQNLDMQGFRVTNVGDPVNADDAVNKELTDELSTRVTELEAAKVIRNRGELTISFDPPSGIPAELEEWVQIGITGV